MDFDLEIPFVRHLGFELVRFEGGDSEIAWSPRPEHLNFMGVAHGGSLWLQDRAGGGLSARVILPLARQRTGRNVASWLGAIGAAMLLLTTAPASTGCSIDEICEASYALSTTPAKPR